MHSCRADSGTCTRALPCKTFAFALSQTAAGGLIIVLDPSGYGKVTITKSVSILNDGVGTAGLAVSSGDAITINAGASDSVHLRGLTIEGSGTGNNGIVFNSGGNLEIENCVVRNFAFVGISITPGTSSSFSVSNTIASKNGGNGIIVVPFGTAIVKGTLSKVTANDNSNDGIVVDGASTTGGMLKVTIGDSEASNNNNDGILAKPFGPTVMLRNSVISNNNNIGLESDKALIFVAHSVVTGNGTGVSGGIESYGDNDIDGNTNDNLLVLGGVQTH